MYEMCALRVFSDLAEFVDPAKFTHTRDSRIPLDTYLIRHEG